MIDYNNKIFRSLNTSKNGEVNSDTVFIIAKIKILLQQFILAEIYYQGN